MIVPAAAGQAETQLWGNVTLDWIKSHRLTFGADIEPKILVSKPPDAPGWATLDVTPSVEYTQGNWFDVVGELLLARTKQTDDLNSTEITPRLGFRFHVLSNVKNDLLKEKLPKRRLVVRNFLRLEWRHLDYSSDTPDSSTFRLRDRVELDTRESSACYRRWRHVHPERRGVVLDGEDIEERYASKQRVRAGIGYRRSRAWRVEALYIWDRSRQAATDGFITSDYAVDVRVRRVW